MTNKKVFIIAEAGVNHNGDLETAKKMVDAAHQAGADAVKFQSFKTENLVIPSNESQFKMLKRLELSKDDHKELAVRCASRGIIFMSSPFDEESVDFLDKLGMGIFKIASGEITNKPLIQHIAGKKKPIMLSTGMSWMEEVEKAVGWIREAWQGLSDMLGPTLLHCVSNYPAAPEDVNLTAIKTLKSAFGLPVGYSDHTQGIEIPIAAAAIGSCIIEKHFTLDRDARGPDHTSSLEVHELAAMVAAIRNVEKALGDGVKKPSAGEGNTRNIARKSLVATRDIRVGDVINRGDVAIKRPGSGLLPEFMERVINKKAHIGVKKDSLFPESFLSDKER